MENNLEGLKSLIGDEFGINRNRINTSSVIDKDLKITGSDAIELIVLFGKKFYVDVSNFNAKDYFDAEGMNWMLSSSSPNKRSLTIGHLEKALIAGKLDEEVINS